MNCKLITFTVLFLLASLTDQALQAQDGKSISTDLFGLFFEDINYAADGGLYAEMVQNRSFEYNPTEQREWHPLSFWEYISPGFSYGQISVETRSPVHPNNPHYIWLNIEHVGHEKEFTGESGVGIQNSGFDGIVIRAGERYHFSLFARQLSDNPVELSVSLQTRKREVLARNNVTTSTREWRKYKLGLTATESSDSALLVVLATSKGTIAMDHISLFPENTFNKRPNGLRADLAHMLADMEPKFVRFPGGCLVHGDGLLNMYRWKNTIGPVEQRLEQRNIWGYHQSAGLGYFEYFQFCEDIGAEPIPILPAAVSCQNSGGTWRIGGTGQKALPEDEMQEYIQEVLDLIEWANGPVNSTWGAKRIEAGHPEPFNLQYIGIGNEDKITPEFKERFRMIYEAVQEKHPEITLIGTSGPFHSGEDFDKGWEFANELKVPIVDEHYYTEPAWFLGNQERYDGYDRNASQVYLGEYASWGNILYNALAEAAYMTSFERNGDIVKMASYAPLLAKRGFTQWKTDLIFFDNVNICPTPNYYVQKMFMTNQGDRYFEGVISGIEQDTLLAGSCVVDSETGDIILKLVNAGTEPGAMPIDLTGFGDNIPSSAEKTVLKGTADAENTFEDPDHVVPVKTGMEINSSFEYLAPAMSLTVIRIETNQQIRR